MRKAAVRCGKVTKLLFFVAFPRAVGRVCVFGPELAFGMAV